MGLIILGYVGFTFIEDLKERYEKNNKKWKKICNSVLSTVPCMQGQCKSYELIIFDIWQKVKSFSEKVKKIKTAPAVKQDAGWNGSSHVPNLMSISVYAIFCKKSRVFSKKVKKIPMAEV